MTMNSIDIKGLKSPKLSAVINYPCFRKAWDSIFTYLKSDYRTFEKANWSAVFIMSSFSRLLFVTLVLLFHCHNAFCISNKNFFQFMECALMTSPTDPEVECRYGSEQVAQCNNKTRCLQGPDQACSNIGIGPRCGGNLRCCGVCIGCYNGVEECSRKMCKPNTKDKKSSTKPFWVLDFYRRQQKQREQMEHQLSDSSFDFKPLVNQPPVINGFEYSLAYGD